VLDGVDMHELRPFLARLFPGIDPSDPGPLPLITDVLSAIDYAVVTGHPPAPGVRPDDLRRMRILVERALVSVLDRTGRQADGAHSGVDGFIRWITEHGSRDAPLTLISSNYDTIVDAALSAHAPWTPIDEHVDFGFAWRDIHGAIHPRPTTPSVRLYKLHGSLNWLRCDLCEHVYIDTRAEIARLGFADEVNPANASFLDTVTQERS
jgi:hypothetical protein